MIAHVVLFKPRADLSSAERDAFTASFERAVTNIPTVHRAWVGERRNLGRFYDQHNAQDFSHIAIIEFKTESDLLAYLEHPAHRELGERFYQMSQTAAAFDFELTSANAVQELLTRGAKSDS